MKKTITSPQLKNAIHQLRRARIKLGRIGGGVGDGAKAPTATRKKEPRKKLAATQNKNRQQVATKKATRGKQKSPLPLAGRVGVGVIKETQEGRDESPSCANAAIDPIIAWEEGIAAVILMKFDHVSHQTIKSGNQEPRKKPTDPQVSNTRKSHLSICLLLGWGQIFLNKESQQFFNWPRRLFPRLNSRNCCSVNSEIFRQINLRPTTAFSDSYYIKICFHKRQCA